jgi:CheY-like chemotaxis protein
MTEHFLTTLHVLLIENAPNALDPLIGALMEEGHTVALARSGEAALQLLSEGLRPSIFVVDRDLGPGMTGLEFLRLCSLNPELQAIPSILAPSRPRREP